MSEKGYNTVNWGSMGYENKVELSTIQSMRLLESNVVDVAYTTLQMTGIDVTKERIQQVLSTEVDIKSTRGFAREIINTLSVVRFILNNSVSFTGMHQARLLNRMFLEDLSESKVGGKLRNSCDFEILQDKIMDVYNSSPNQTLASLNVLIFILKEKPFKQGNKATAFLLATHIATVSGIGLILVNSDNLGIVDRLTDDSLGKINESTLRYYLYEKCIVTEVENKGSGQREEVCV